MSLTRSEFLIGLAGVGGTTLISRVEMPLAQEPTLRQFLNAVTAGDVAAVSQMLQAEPALAAARTVDRVSALLLALLGGRTEVAQLIRTRLTAVDLFEAVALQDAEGVRAIIARRPDAVHEWLPSLGTPLHVAVRLGNNDMIGRVSGADYDAASDLYKGPSALRLAIEAADPKAAEAMSRNLLANGADPNIPQPDGITPLHAAAKVGIHSVVRHLIRKGAAVNAKDPEGRAPADYAKDAAIKQLLANEASVPRDHMKTRLSRLANGQPYVAPESLPYPQSVVNRFVGAAHSDLSVCHAMVKDYPRIVFAESSVQELAVEASAHVGLPDGVKWLLDLGSPYSITTAAMLGDLETVKKDLAADPGSVHAQGPHDHPLVMYPTIAGGHLEMAELILEKGADPNACTAVGMTALHRAVASEQPDMVRLLVKKGADRNFKNNRGQSPVDLARTMGEKMRSALEG